jgi:hypothetical protein
MPWLAPGRIATALAGLAVVLLILNRRVYQWFAGKRGLLFAAGAVLVHWAYYFYSGVVYVLLRLRHAVRPGSHAVGRPQSA